MSVLEPSDGAERRPHAGRPWSNEGERRPSGEPEVVNVVLRE